LRFVAGPNSRPSDRSDVSDERGEAIYDGFETAGEQESFNDRLVVNRLVVLGSELSA
jgi:hypothetical protein